MIRKAAIAAVCVGYCLAASADVSTQTMIKVEQSSVEDSQRGCEAGMQSACDEVLLSQAEILLLQLELRHPSGRIYDALLHVRLMMLDLHHAVDDQK
jgi:hypothetical protein